MPFTTLVSTEVLAAHVGEWAIVDCRFDLANDAWGREQYAAGHIPGAVYASLNDDLSAPRTGTNGRHPLPSQDALVATLQRLGIANGTQVVVYDQDSGLYAGRLWWLLRYAGHQAVALLDGGFAKWTAEGRPVSAGVETRPRSTFRPAFDAAMHVTVDEVARRAADGHTLLVDARGADRFEGRAETIDKVAGHIPGAQNRFYQSNLGARRHDAERGRPARRVHRTARRARAARRDHVLRFRRERLPQPAGHGARGAAGQPALHRLVVRVVGRPVEANRDRPTQDRSGRPDRGRA